MKSPILISAAILFFLWGCREMEQRNTLAASFGEMEENPESTIKKIIENETLAYVNRDSTQLLSYYVTDDVTQSAWNNHNGTYGLHKGFEAISKNFRKQFKEHPERLHLPDVTRNDWYFRPLSKEWMWVNFIQKVTGTDGKLYTSYETRLMKKDGGQWKIAVMYALSDHAVK
jgi:ketosteroid isomerase-like protein